MMYIYIYIGPLRVIIQLVPGRHHHRTLCRWPGCCRGKSLWFVWHTMACPVPLSAHEEAFRVESLFRESKLHLAPYCLLSKSSFSTRCKMGFIEFWSLKPQARFKTRMWVFGDYAFGRKTISGSPSYRFPAARTLVSQYMTNLLQNHGSRRVETP